MAKKKAGKEVGNTTTESVKPKQNKQKNQKKPKKEEAKPEEPKPLWLKLFDFVWTLALVAARCYCLYYILWEAYDMRLHAVKTFGVEIHEFDPWFNFRATEYLERNGAAKFMTWFDTESWSPLGRPVGTTIFPGMQFTAVALYRAAQYLKTYYPVFDVSLKFICVYMPAWFGAGTSLMTGALTAEISGSWNAGVIGAAVMAVIPAHMMRSVAGGFDNECVAVFALCLTFYFWIRSLRNMFSAIFFGILTGLAYFYMVAAWGGYIFVVNMIGIHAGALIVFGYYSKRLYWAYSLFYVIGTAGALQIPIVGMNPLRSAEQLGPMAVFLGMQVIAFVVFFMEKYKIPKSQVWKFAYVFSCAVVAVLALVGKYLIDAGMIWEFSVRIKSLFIPHTKTGNPLVDSVAEHQSTPDSFYDSYLHETYWFSIFGMVLCLLYCIFQKGEKKWFVVTYFCICFYFSTKMVRLVLLLAPVVSICVGMILAVPFDWGFRNMFRTKFNLTGIFWKILGFITCFLVLTSVFGDVPLRKKPWKIEQPGYHIADIPLGGGKPIPVGIPQKTWEVPRVFWKKAWRLLLKKPHLLIKKTNKAQEFYNHCKTMAPQLSSPQIMLEGQRRDGSKIKIDDFREAYWWLRDNTPKSSRVMAWWDYGYQINGIANRTTIADGNTWNHEHIALLGRCLVSNEQKSWRMIRHLADYVLVWTTRYAGMYGDDLAKSPHMARISGSVYPDIDPSQYWFDQQSGQATPMMEQSLLYKLHFYRLDPSKKVKLKYYKEVYTTKNSMVRIYKVLKVDQKSKKHPFGSYPPKLQKTLKLGKSFSEVKRLTRLRANKFD